MRVLIVDDHPIVASGCRAVLADGRHKDFAIDVPSGGQTEPIHLTW